jgi:hypothetical protein
LILALNIRALQTGFAILENDPHLEEEAAVFSVEATSVRVERRKSFVPYLASALPPAEHGAARNYPNIHVLLISFLPACSYRENWCILEKASILLIYLMIHSVFLSSSLEHTEKAAASICNEEPRSKRRPKI